MKAKIFILCLLFIVSFIVAKASPFVTRWDLSIGGSGTTQLSFGVGTSGTATYTWETIPAGQTGSGTFTDSTLTILGLPTGAMIRLSIDSVNFNRIRINYGFDRSRLLDVEQWGTVKWVNMHDAFTGCSNLDISATDIPDLNLVNNMNLMFYHCFALLGPTNINLWNTSSVTEMQWMFSGAYAFNQPIGSWNTSNVISMYNMFYSASAFNQPIGSWNTSSLKIMNYMFDHAYSFNQSLGTWNLQNVIQLIGLFDHSGMDCSNYSNTLIGWNANPSTPNNINIHHFAPISLHYDLNAQFARTHLITSKGWSIIGDTLSAFNCGPTYYYTFLNQTICNGDIFLNHTNSGIYIDTLLSIGGIDTIRTLSLTVNPNPSIIQNGFNLSASNVQNVTLYSWYMNGLPIGGNFDTVTITQNGVYVLAVKDSNNCIGYDTLHVISLDASNIASSKRAIQVYPNPSSGVFSIDIPEDHAQDFSVQITDLVGATVYKEEVKNIQQGIYHHKIDFSSLGLNEGMYMLSVTSDQGKYMPVKLIYRKE